MTKQPLHTGDEKTDDELIMSWKDELPKPTHPRSHNFALGMIQYFVGFGFGSVFATLSPGFGYAIFSVVMILFIIFVWPHVEVRLIEHGWMKEEHHA